MFENIGKKIKTYAKVITWLGIIFSALVFLLACVNAGASSGDSALVVAGLIYAIVLGLLSWISSFFTYAFGELVEQSQWQTEYLYRLLSSKESALYNANGAGSAVPAWKRVQMERQSQDPQ